MIILFIKPIGMKKMKKSLFMLATILTLAGCTAAQKAQVDEKVEAVREKVEVTTEKIAKRTKELVAKAKVAVKEQRKVSACWNTAAALENYEAFGHNLSGRNAVRAKALSIALEKHCVDSKSSRELMHLLKPYVAATEGK